MPNTPVIMNNATDTWVYQYQPTKAQGTAGTVLYVGADTGKITRTLLYWSLPFPRGVTILSAKIRMVQYGSITGSKSVTCYRATKSWSATKVTWNTCPTWAQGVTVTKSGTPGATVWEWDVSALMQTVSNGAAWYGFILGSGQAQTRFCSPNYTTVGYRPVLEMSWKDNPKTPTTMNPDGGRATALTKPTLQCDFTDLSGDTSMAAIQVRIFTSQANADANTPSEFDSGEVAADVPELDLSTTAYGGVPADATRWWRVRVKDGAGLWSNWSASGSFVVKTDGVITFNSPGNVETRRNMIKNPTWRATASTREIRRNLAPNPRAFTNTTGWSVSAGTSGTAAITQITGQTGPITGVTTAARATWSVAATAANAYMFLGTTTAGASEIPVVAGEYMSWLIYMRVNQNSQTWRPQVNYYDSGGAFLSSLTGTAIATASGIWYTQWVQGQVPANAVRAIIAPTQVSGTVMPINATMDCTAVLVERQCSANLGFFDGASAAFDGLTPSWVGTAHLSASTLTGADVVGLAVPFQYYASTPGVIGWVPAPGTYKILSKMGHSGLFGFSAYAPVACGEGEWWAARMQARNASGTAATNIMPRIGSYSAGGANLSSDQSIVNNVFSMPTDGSWVDINMPSNNPTPVGATTIRFMVYSSGTMTAGTIIEFRNATLEKVGVTGWTIEDYFDGSSLDTATVDYSWASTVDASESIKKEAFVAEATPIIDWTFTGRTQKAYQVAVQRADGGGTWLWNSGKITSTGTAVTVPANVLKWNNIDYIAMIRIWDNIDREATPGDPIYVEKKQRFRYLYDATINPAINLVSTKDTRYPWMKLTWSRGTIPDSWNIYRDNVLIKTDVASNLATTPGNYEYWDRIPDPRKQCTWSVVAVVNGKGSSPNPTTTDTVIPVTATLCRVDGTNPVLIWNYQHDMSLTEVSSVFQVAGSGPPIIITQAEHGYQGKLSGLLADNPYDPTVTPQQWRDRFNQLKKNNGTTLLLTLIDVAFECFIQNATIKPLIDGQGVKYYVEFEFFQTDWVEVT